jgi:patatin-like phospholipase/acyl hydrolase
MRRWIPQWVLHIFTYVCKGSLYQNKALKDLLEKHYGIDTKLKDCKTRLCVTTYELKTGEMHILKTPHHSKYVRDLHMRAVDAAMATSAAPVYFKPYSFEYSNKEDKIGEHIHDVDGGMFANNPALIGLLEILRTEKVSLNDIHLLSLGTGNISFKESDTSKKMGVKYWIVPDESSSLRIYDVMASAQSTFIDNMMKLLQQGVGGTYKDRPFFDYVRVQKNLGKNIPLDASDNKVLEELDNIGQELWKEGAKDEVRKSNKEILSEFIKEKVKPYKKYNHG